MEWIAAVLVAVFAGGLGSVLTAYYSGRKLTLEVEAQVEIALGDAWALFADRLKDELEHERSLSKSSQKEARELAAEVGSLTTQVARLTLEVDALKRERDELRNLLEEGDSGHDDE